MTKPTKCMCAPIEDSDQPQPSTQSDQESLLCALWVAKDLTFLKMDSKLFLDWADPQADLSLLWAQRSFCWFCHEVAQMFFPG